MIYVQQDSRGKYIVLDGRRFSSDELPPEGTEVDTEEFTAIGDVQGVDVSWHWDSLSGHGFARIIGEG